DQSCPPRREAVPHRGTALLRRPVRGGDGPGSWYFRAHRKTRMGARQGLALPRAYTGVASMTAEEWVRLKAVFDECLDLDADQRRRHLDAHCPEPEIRREVEPLLESYEHTETFIERPALEEPAAM